MLFLSKLLSLLVFPLGLAILLGLLALLIPRRPGLSRLLVGIAVFVLWVTSMPVFAKWLTATLESTYPPVQAETMPIADAVVILGGSLGQPVPPRIAPDLRGTADRIVEGWRLYRAGRAPKIVISGGNLPWSTAAAPEAVLVKDFLLELGVPEDAIIVEAESRNTHENAVNTAGIFSANGWTRGLLVTSASHMPRALAAFERSGLRMVPAPTDIESTHPLADSILDLLPSADALAMTTTALKEWFGLAYYRIRGWA